MTKVLEGYQLAVIRIVVRGLVQGVGFRWWAMRTARDLGVDGWVANNPDGSVEIAASGSDRSVARLVDLCRTGPAGAVVDSVDSHAHPGAVGSGFRISGR